ncbi:MAG: disulfide bond formation protein B [Microthrixaceae bacterium]|nr:disulfide bond formation protein B [Microthrixaceae bacterium]
MSLLAVLCVAFLVVVVPISLWSLARGRVPTALQPIRDGLAQAALPMAFAVALVTTLGSLWLSEVEKLPPCELCWFQRIFMYPNAIILGIAVFRRDVSVRWYSLPLVVVGAAISTYHYLLERFPDDISYECTTETPCTTVWIWKYHFLSIPGMAWVAFVTIAVLLMLARRSPKHEPTTTDIDQPTAVDRELRSAQTEDDGFLVDDDAVTKEELTS